MRRMPIPMLLSLLLLAACQSTSPQTTTSRTCTIRLEEAGQCSRESSISSFPELANVN